jgi:RNA polymerase I-specific transcription initiation factor RRN6
MFHDNSLATSTLVSSSNPTSLDLYLDQPRTGYVTQLYMEPLRFQGDVASDIPGPGHSYVSRGLQFYKLFATRSDLSIHEIILYSKDPASEGKIGSYPLMEDIRWSSVYRPRRGGRPAKEMDDFILYGGSQLTEGPRPKLASQIPQWLEGQNLNAAHRLVEHVLLYDALTQEHIGEDAQAASIDFVVVARQLKHMILDDDDLSKLPTGTV